MEYEENKLYHRGTVLIEELNYVYRESEIRADVHGNILLNPDGLYAHIPFVSDKFTALWRDEDTGDVIRGKFEVLSHTDYALSDYEIVNDIHFENLISSIKLDIL